MGPLDVDQLLAFSTSATEACDTDGDELQLLEVVLISLKNLYTSNVELTKLLQSQKEANVAIEAHAAKWQKLATTAVARAKDSETQRLILEDRARGAEQEAVAAQRALASYKNKFANSFHRLRQAQELITSSPKMDDERNLRIVRAG
jgi:hypothetical protein